MSVSELGRDSYTARLQACELLREHPDELGAASSLGLPKANCTSLVGLISRAGAFVRTRRYYEAIKTVDRLLEIDERSGTMAVLVARILVGEFDQAETVAKSDVRMRKLVLLGNSRPATSCAAAGLFAALEVPLDFASLAHRVDGVLVSMSFGERVAPVSSFDMVLEDERVDASIPSPSALFRSFSSSLVGATILATPAKAKSR